MLDGDAQIARDLQHYKRGKVYQLSESAVLKIGRDVKRAEAETLRLIAREAPNVPVPAVLHAYRDEERGKGYIVMSKLEGEPLHRHWVGMTPEERERIVGQSEDPFLAGSMVALVLTASSNTAMALQRIPIHAMVPIAPVLNFLMVWWRPCATHDQQAIGIPLDDQTEARVLADGRTSQSEEADDDDDAEMVLTHGDLHMGNILVKDGLVTGIVDWAEAGYSIREREYVESETKSLPVSLGAGPFPDQYVLWEYVTNEMRAYTGV
ncbi:MAG: hypothetical protein M1817_003907 [Caeruleum heppii]|nr:MAG: hypothetical protein M1817_003907 [Caeruleum heppii]